MIQTERDIWITADQVFDGEKLSRGAVRVVDGHVTEFAAQAPRGSAVQTINGVLTPGFLDLQVNGGGDVLFNTDQSLDGLARIVAAHRRFGTVGMLPTVITDAPDVMGRAAEAILAARSMRGVLGIHIEGPHISVARRGTHAERYIRPLDAPTIAQVKGLRGAGIAVMITVAPEAVTADQVAALSGMGAVVSLGHTDATAADTRAALAAGASCFTHLYNAMSPMLNRAPGVVGAAINSEAYTGIICDGIHVAYEMLGLAIRARPVADKIFLVSDAMPTIGGSGEFRLYDMKVHLENGRLVNDEGSLAGAHVTMAESVVRAVAHVGVSLETALRMAITIPARVVGQPERAKLVGVTARDLIVLDSEGRLITGPDEAAA